MATMGFGTGTRGAFRTLFPLVRLGLRRNIGLSRAQLDGAKARLASYFDRIERELGPSGYLVGDRFGVADLAVASIMTAILRPPEFPYPLPEPWPPALVELRESLAHRAGYAWVIETYRKHRGASAEIVAGAPRLKA
jgi:glutathione S-transferase